MSSSVASPPKLSDQLLTLRAGLGERLSLGEGLSLIEDRAYGGVLLVLTLPCLLPVPPILSMIMEGPLMLVALQMIFGRETPWLPGPVRRLGLPRERAQRLIDAVLPRLRRLEALVRPRWRSLADGRAQVPLGVLCLLSASLVGIPVPLIGWLPGFALALIAIGLIGEDGVIVALGMVVGITGLVCGAFLLVGTIDMGDHLLNAAQG